VRVVREVDTGRRVGGATAGVDAERADLPIGGNRPNREEDEDQAGEEEQEAEPPATATASIVIHNRHIGDGGPDKDELPSQYGDRRLRSQLQGNRLRHRHRGGGDDGLHDRFWLYGAGRQRRARRCRDAIRQPGQPFIELRLIGERSRIVCSGRTPWEEAHLGSNRSAGRLRPLFRASSGWGRVATRV
jgi:hypothetical protein